MEYFSTFLLLLLTSTSALSKWPDPNLKRATSNPTCTITPELQTIISSAPFISQDIYIEFPSRLNKVKTKPDVIKATDRNEKARIVQTYLKNYSDEDHKLILAGIKLLNLPASSTVNSFWIANSISITAASPTIINSITSIKSSAPCVINFAPKTYLHSTPYSLTTGDDYTDSDSESSSSSESFSNPDCADSITWTPLTPSDVPWGVQRIGAPAAWNLGHFGQGITVAIVDSGVNLYHESLSGRWDGHWCDPVAEQKIEIACKGPLNNSQTGFPIDSNGHGTAVASIIVGGKGVGIAPKASWRACRQFDETENTTYNWIMVCAEWTSSATTSRDLPHVVANSWGTPYGGYDFFNRAINLWNELGIHHVFSIGNSGPNCLTAASPGDQAVAFGVGNVDFFDTPYIDSSRGVSPFNFNLKPDISAPGTRIHVADLVNDDPTNNNGYTTATGTSFAAAHTAGAIALILSDKTSHVIEFPPLLKNMLMMKARKPDTTLFEQDTCCFQINYYPFKPYPNAAMGFGILDLSRWFAPKTN